MTRAKSRAARQLVIFDCDGTLVDSQQAVVQAVQDALAACGQPPTTRAIILRSYGLPLDAAMELYAPAADAAQRRTLIRAWQDATRAVELQADRGQVLFAGMRDAVVRLAEDSDTMLGIVTMRSRKGLERVLQVSGLAPCFRISKTADDGPPKPAPDLLLDAMQACGAAASDTVMVGDTNYDMQMAQAAGVCALGVAWGYQDTSELTQAGAAHILDTPLSLLQFLRQRAWRG